jgi:hypothetical protein
VGSARLSFDRATVPSGTTSENTSQTREEAEQASAIDCTASSIRSAPSSTSGWSILEYAGGVVRHHHRPAGRHGRHREGHSRRVAGVRRARSHRRSLHPRVSSPGLERTCAPPIQRAIGSTVRIKFAPAVDGERRIDGVLTAADGEGCTVTLVAPASGERHVRYDDVERGSARCSNGAHRPSPAQPGAGKHRRQRWQAECRRRQAECQQEGGQRMNAEFMEALNALAVEKGISVETLLSALADALESAYKRMPGAHEYAWVTIDPDTGEIRVFAQELNEDGEPVGDELDVTPDDFGRIAARRSVR